jgi:Leucine-rich repeat (LRR) protein
MLYNSVNYILSLGIGWLNPEMKTAEIAPGSEININMMFDASGLKSGKHHASIVINSNDPVHPVIAIPATLEVNSLNDSLSLVALYSSTNGENWLSHTNWLTGRLNTWQGITMENGRVTGIYLADNNLSGYITPEIGNLTSLRSLDLHSNLMTGAIPEEIGSLSNLHMLNIGGNQLTGSIPGEIGNLTGLEEFSAGTNRLSGSIPPEIGSLINLKMCWLAYNQLTGPIPPEIGSMTNLEQLWIQNNYLSGNIPVELGNLQHIRFIILFQNQLTGSIPHELGNLETLEGLWLYSNQLTGSIPEELGNLPLLEDIQLSYNQLTGNVPESFANLTKLMTLTLMNNKLENLPALTNSPSLGILFIENNKFNFKDIEPNIGLPRYSFTFSPQDSIGEEQHISLNEGDDYTISLITGGSHNVYQWYKNGVFLPGATSNEYRIISAAAENTGNYTCEVTNTVATGLTLYSRPVTVNVKCNPHFTPVWSGNGLDHMNFYILTAKLDYTDLQPGDEIGIFDGGACVGSGVLTEVLNGTNVFEIRVSKDDPITPEKDGYTPGQNASFRIWDVLRRQEVIANDIEYVFGTNIFEIGASTWLRLGGFSHIEQMITLQGGWNIFSLNVAPDSMALIDIVRPLIYEGVLLKVQNEAGAAIEPIPGTGTWIDNIGNWSRTEGYKIRVSTNTTLIPKGIQLNSSVQIDLQVGWNIMGYPFYESQSAMDALNGLISRGTLMKVQDETGAAIEPLPQHAGWIDNIGDFDPGEGYKVRVSGNDIIDLYPNAGISAILKSSVPASDDHFKRAWRGNGMDHMNIYIRYVTEGNDQPKTGDEIGIFDGETCVGSGIVKETKKKLISLVVSADDPTTPETDGFVSGNTMSFRIWRSEENTEFKIANVEYTEGYSGTFEPMGTTIAGLKLNLRDPAGNVTSLGENYPNPFAVETVIPFTVGETTTIDLSIYNLMGQRVYTLVQATLEMGSYTATWNGKDQNGEQAMPGIYLSRLVSGNKVFVKRIELIK